mgnify:CR=1 FL=1
MPRSVLALILCVLLAGCDRSPQLAESPSPFPAGDGVARFLTKHWDRPLRAQGSAPFEFGPLERSLEPEACGNCHSDQVRDWKASLHSRAIGPGVLGQLVDMNPSNGDEHQDCLRCHAPLKEQAVSLVEALNRSRPDPRIRPAHEQGLTCAGCHVREHVRYGPPRRDGTSPTATDSGLPHGGWTASEAFEDPRFCSTCHQFSGGDFKLNGKYLENTYEEWKASRHAREGRTCQSCHMPDRRHLWRGIHDKDMVKGGVTISFGAPGVEAGTVQTALTIRNTETGHMFPTYVTPKVVAEIYQADIAGKPLSKTLRTLVIAREVESDLSAEIADTRLAPDESATLAYSVPVHARAVFVYYRVRVEPDAFYAVMYEGMLRSGGSARGGRMIQAALFNARRSGFTFYEGKAVLPSGRRNK